MGLIKWKVGIRIWSETQAIGRSYELRTVVKAVQTLRRADSANPILDFCEALRP